MKDISKYTTIILDFDGVLVDSNLLKQEMFYQIWEDNNQDIRIIIDDVLSCPGDRYSYIRKIHHQLSKTQKLNHSPEYYFEKYSRSVEDEIVDQGLKPDAEAFLKKHSNHLKLINSATPENHLKQIVQKLKLNGLIQEARGLPMKKQDIFRYFIQTYQLSRSNIVFIGDMKSDETVALETGIDFIGIKSSGSDLKDADCQSLAELS